MKHNRLNLYATCVIAGCGLACSAAAAESSPLADASAPPAYYPWTVGFEAGTDGLMGAFGGWRFSDHLGVRLGADWTEASFSAVGVGGTDYDVRARLLSEHLTLDYYPWQQHSFHISLGVRFNQNELSGSASHTLVTIIDGEVFPTDEVGTLSLNIKPQPVNPSISVGGNLFYFDRAHRWAMGGEIGIAYTGGAEVSLTRSGGSGDPGPIDAAVSRAERRAQRFADQLKFWPVAKLSVTYSF